MTEITINHVSEARRNGISPGALRQRVNRGWPIERAVSEPLNTLHKGRAQWIAIAAANGISRSNFNGRVNKRGMSYAEAATHGVDPAKAVKYIITDITMKFEGRTLHRIQAAKTFIAGDVVKSFNSRTVKVGELGGWIEKEYNLSQSGCCWIAQEAKVFNRGQVLDNAFVFGSVVISDFACVCDNSEVFGAAKITESANVEDKGRVYDHATLKGSAVVSGYGRVSGYALLDGFATVTDMGQVSDNCILSENSTVDEYATLEGSVTLKGNSLIGGMSRLSGTYVVSSNEYIFSANHVGSENGTFTAVLDNTGEIHITRGCFTGTLAEFENKLKERHGETEFSSETVFYEEYVKLLEFVKLRFKNAADR